MNTLRNLTIEESLTSNGHLFANNGVTIRGDVTIGQNYGNGRVRLEGDLVYRENPYGRDLTLQTTLRELQSEISVLKCKVIDLESKLVEKPKEVISTTTSVAERQIEV